MLSRIPHPLQRPPPLYPRARRLMHEFRHRLRRTVPGNPYECPEAFWSFVSGTIRQRRYIFSLILKWWISAAVEGRGIRASPLSRSVFIVPCFCFFFDPRNFLIVLNKLFLIHRRFNICSCIFLKLQVNERSSLIIRLIWRGIIQLVSK